MKKYGSMKAKARVPRTCGRSLCPSGALIGADLHDLLGVLRRRLGVGVQIQVDVGLDVLDRPVGAGRDRLGGGTGEPEDHGATGDETEQERSVDRAQQRGDLAQVGERLVTCEVLGEEQDDREDHRGRAATAVPMSTGFAVALKVLPAPSFSSSIALAWVQAGL